MSSQTEQIVSLVKIIVSKLTCQNFLVTLRCKPGFKFKIISFGYVKQVDLQNLRTLFHYHFVQTESSICATITYQCDGSAFPETWETKNFTFVQWMPKETETYAQSNKKIALSEIERWQWRGEKCTTGKLVECRQSNLSILSTKEILKI